jgi:Na+/H+ antiporter NhaD/arsenite permease-like protein
MKREKRPPQSGRAEEANRGFTSKPTGTRMLGAAALFVAALFPTAVLAISSEPAPGVEQAEHAIGVGLPLWSVLPFVGILLSIALFPLLAPHFWHRHYPKVSLGWALLFAVPFLFAYRGDAWEEILHIALIDYIPFIILLWGLFTVSGGIVLRGSLAGTPKVNTAFLLIGTFIASWTGTTGAAMLLIRPVLRTNAHRRYKVHVIIFFIFLVANIGGSLTPLGDPPLFLGFLHHVPFFWTFHLLPMMGFAAGLLLVIFYLLDRYFYHKEAAEGHEKKVDGEKKPLRVDGLVNLIFLGGILGAVLLSGFWKPGEFEVMGVHVAIQNMVRDLLIVSMGLLSLWATPKALRKDNAFTWEPIREVALLFAGIFMTIIPALAILKAGEAGHFAFLVKAVKEPWQYFWAAGSLSSFLDNAPTYLTFFNMELGRFYPGLVEPTAVAELIKTHAVYLEAVAAGAVFMGANTYIGNAPNFMVRSIAEEAGIDMPSFFGYMFRWSIPILIPIFILTGLIFF